MKIQIKKLNRITVSNIFWFLIFLMIALPLHASNSLLGYLSLTGMISWFQIFIGTIFIYAILQNFILKFTRLKIFNTFFGITLIVTFLVGFLNEAHASNNVIGDAGMYILSFMIFLLVSENRIKAKPMRDLLLFVFHAMTVNLAINCLMYFTQNFSFWGLESFNGGRFGGGYYSLLIISVVYGFYDFMSEKRISAKEFYLHMGMAVFCSILAQSRTHVFLCLAGFVLVFCFRTGKLSAKYLIRAFIVIVIGIVAIILFMNSGNPLVERILSTNIHSSTETTASRIYTWTYYWRRICENPTGTGFGEIMYFINPSLTIATSTATYYVDNAYAVVLYKGGFLYGVLYFMPLYAALVKLIISWRKMKNNAYLMYAAIWVMFIFATTVLTSQIIHTYAVNTFTWIFAGCVCNKRFSEEELD